MSGGTADTVTEREVLDAHFDSRANVLTDRERELGAIIAAYNDVTERLKQSHDQLQSQVEGLRRELADKNRELARRERLSALGEMAAGVAHEIRNPLGSIQLFASLLDRDLADRPTEQTTVRKIGRAVDCLDRIVNDILAFTGEAEPVCRDVALAPIFAEAVDGVAVTLRKHGTQLHVHVQPEGSEVRADPEQLRRAVANLLQNGAVAAGDGGRLDIGARLRPDRNTVEITVIDDGPGIAPELLDRIFNPFFTTRDSGTGLGLAIVHRIVEGHGGSIAATNRPEGGACFRMTLPLADGADH